MIEEEIYKIKSKELRADFILKMSDEDRLKDLLEAFYSGTKQIRTRASWVLQGIDNLYNGVLIEYTTDLINHLPNCITDAEKRFLMRYFIENELPKDEDELGILLEYGFQWLADPKESIAARANAMVVVFRLVKIFPELKNELKETLIDILAKGASAGMTNRAHKVLNKLDKLLTS